MPRTRAVRERRPDWPRKLVTPIMAQIPDLEMIGLIWNEKFVRWQEIWNKPRNLALFQFECPSHGLPLKGFTKRHTVVYQNSIILSNPVYQTMR